MTSRLVATVHLGPLPGAPRFGGDFEAVLSRALDDAMALRDAGFDALLIENFGDAPFYPDDVPKVTIAAMARAVATIRAAVELPLGVNVLRNDALGALAVAAATGARFIRVNVLTGTMFTDQGSITGKAAELARAREALRATHVEVLADVFVKHAVPPPGADLVQSALETYERGGADGLVITGAATGVPPDLEEVRSVRKVLSDAPLLVGSGLTRDDVSDFLEVCDGVIVGSDVKEDGRVSHPVDPKRAEAFVQAARRA